MSLHDAISSKSGEKSIKSMKKLLRFILQPWTDDEDTGLIFWRRGAYVQRFTVLYVKCMHRYIELMCMCIEFRYI